MPKVFISHSNQDDAATLFLADSLRRAGIDVWVDFENIRGGADWLCEIQAGIARCDAVVVALSKASADSVWVERECLYAFQLRKPVFTALLADMLIPLHLINIQYCDLRERREAGMAKLAESILSALGSADDARLHAPAAVSRLPIEANFFPYVEQLPDGETATLVARDLYHWARGLADDVDFGGASNPGFSARIRLGRKRVTVFSVRAYRLTPVAQIPFDHLAAHKPYRRKTARVAALRVLNRLLPRSQRLKAQKAKGRPSIPLRQLSSAEKLEAFKALLREITSNLRANAKSA